MRIRRQGVVVMEPPKEMTVGNLVAEAKQILADKKLASIERRESRPLTNKDTYRELYEKWLANGKGKIPTCRRCGDAVLHWNEPAHVCEGFKPKFVEHDDAWHEKQEARRAEIRASNQDRPKKCIVCHEVIRDYDDACYHEEHCCFANDLLRGRYWYTDYDPIVGDNDGHECYEDEPEEDYCEGDDDGYDCD